jgi:cytidyltransferase-like protein
MIYGFTCGAFDLIHPGYIDLFKEARGYCDHLIVGINLISKHGRVHSPLDTRKILEAIKYIDQTFLYKGEKQLLDKLISLKSLNQLHIRFLGDDYIGKPFTGEELNIPIHYVSRQHGLSTTKLIGLVKNL